jgi:sugar lactone lactonase YvrE
VLDGAGRGRLLRWDPASGALETLLCGLHFPNGVQLLHQEPGPEGEGESLLVVESSRFRILKVDLQALSPAALQVRGTTGVQAPLTATAG